MTMPSLADLLTPALVLDLDRLEANCARMAARAEALGVRLRPHLKTAKAAEVARLATGDGGPITVSTLAEVDYFAKAGFGDITYGVGIAASKVPALAALQRAHAVAVNLVTDNLEAVRAVAAAAVAEGAAFAIFIEIDSGGGRGGVAWDGSELLPLAEAIAVAPALTLAGVLTHAGQSYGAASIDAIVRIAEDERLAAVSAAERLRAAGFDVPQVSVGSTPTATFAASLEGVTEMRPGVYTLCDLKQAMLGVCRVENVALSVLATIIGRNPRSDRLLIDAGGLALSKDVSAGKLDPHYGYGLVCGMDGALIPGARVVDVDQEHGFVALDGGIAAAGPAFAVGSKLRILPNHACMTAAPYDRYHVVRGGGDEVLAVWDKATGW